MNEATFKKRISNSRKAIIKALADVESLSWSKLKIEFFGEKRAKSASQRSFSTQLKNLQELGIITKTTQGEYTLTNYGKKLYEDNKDKFENVISDARKLFEAQEAN